MGLFDTITAVMNDTIESQPATMTGTVKSYHDGVCTVETTDGTMENLPCVNIPKIGTSCLLVPVDGDYQCIPNEVDDTSLIFSQGLGKFHIDDNGHLIFELPIGVENYMSINSSGHLIVDLDSETNAKFKIVDGECIYG